MDANQPPDPGTWLAEHGDYLYQFALVRLHNRAAAEDAVQETLLAGIQALGRYDGRTPVRYWLRGILRHKVVDYIRQASREVAIDDPEGDDLMESHSFKAFGVPDLHPPPWRFNPDKAYERKEFWEVFAGCMAKLPDAMGHAFALRELEGMPTEAVCKEMGVKPNNLWVLLHRARTKLKACLEANWECD